MRLKFIILKFRLFKFLGRFIPYFKKMGANKYEFTELVYSRMEKHVSENIKFPNFRYQGIMNHTNENSKSLLHEIAYSYGDVIFYFVLEFKDGNVTPKIRFFEKPLDNIEISDMSEIINLYNHFKKISIDDLLEIFNNIDWKS